MIPNAEAGRTAPFTAPFWLEVSVAHRPGGLIILASMQEASGSWFCEMYLVPDLLEIAVTGDAWW